MRILSAAEDLFRRLGPARVALRRVAEQAGVSVGLINYHFDSKQGLLEAVFDVFFSTLIEDEAAHLEAFETADDMGAALERSFRHGFGITRKHRVAMRISLSLIGKLGALPLEWRSRRQDGFLRRWSAAVSRRSGLPQQLVRLRIHNLLALSMRYVAASESELRMILGAPELDLEACRDAIEDQLAMLAHAIVAPVDVASPRC